MHKRETNGALAILNLFRDRVAKVFAKKKGVFNSGNHACLLQILQNNPNPRGCQTANGHAQQLRDTCLLDKHF